MAEHIAVDSYDLDFEPIDLDEIVREIMQPMMDMTSAEFQRYVEERQHIKASMLPEERVSAVDYCRSLVATFGYDIGLSATRRSCSIIANEQ